MSHTPLYDDTALYAQGRALIMMIASVADFIC